MHECTSNCRKNGCPDPKASSYCYGTDCDDDYCRCEPTPYQELQEDVEDNNKSLAKNL